MYESIVSFLESLGIAKSTVDLFYGLIPLHVVLIFVLTIVPFLVLMERKVLAWMTVREGPNRVGPGGILQSFADGIKLLFKEDIMADRTDKFLFTYAPILFFAPVLIIYVALPFTHKLVSANLAAGLFFILAVSSISTVGIVLAGWASNNKYSLIGGMRSAAQAISYEIPLVISAISIVLAAGSLNLMEIITQQTADGKLLGMLPVMSDLAKPVSAGELSQISEWGLLNWYVFPHFIAFVIFVICSLAEINRVPFDLPEAESELVAGYNTEYSGMKFALFFLAEYAALFLMSALAVVLFLGGFTSPFNIYLTQLIPINVISDMDLRELLVHAEQGIWFMGKTFLFIFGGMWVRATLPRMRPDQMMGFCWKILIPLSLFNLFFVVICKELLGRFF